MKNTYWNEVIKERNTSKSDTQLFIKELIRNASNIDYEARWKQMNQKPRELKPIDMVELEKRICGE